MCALLIRPLLRVWGRLVLTSLVTVVNRTDIPRSIRNRRVTDVLVTFLYCHVAISIHVFRWCMAFCHKTWSI